jgi:hypothetical protein
MTIAQRNRSDQTISRPLEAVSGYLDAAGAFAGDWLADLLSPTAADSRTRPQRERPHRPAPRTTPHRERAAGPYTG